MIRTEPLQEREAEGGGEGKRDEVSFRDVNELAELPERVGVEPEIPKTHFKASRIVPGWKTALEGALAPPSSTVPWT